MRIQELIPDLRVGDRVVASYPGTHGDGCVLILNLNPLTVKWERLDWVPEEVGKIEIVREGRLNDWAKEWKLSETSRVQRILENYEKN
jgi:hypothetical protein